MNWVFIFLIVGSVVTAALNGRMAQLNSAAFESGRTSIELALTLAGQMTLWLGLMGILSEAGILNLLSRLLRPLMTRLFPEVPPNHPATGAMVLNIAANMLGLGNAATPFGLKAMRELDRLNPRPGEATNSMALFLTLNNAGVVLLPLSAIALRASVGSKHPGAIILPSLIGTLTSALAAVLIAKRLERPHKNFVAQPVRDYDAAPDAQTEDAAQIQSGKRQVGAGIGVALILLLLAVRAAILSKSTGHPFVLSDWLIPFLIVGFLVIGVVRRVKVYETFVVHAREGFQLAVGLIPYLVGILLAVGMLRASGALDLLIHLASPLTRRIGLPAEALPMALIRPFSGSGAMAVMVETMKVYGPDSFIGYLVSLLNGTSETTFYILAIYFGSVQVRSVRHTLVACLLSDGVALVITVGLSHLFFGPLR